MRQITQCLFIAGMLLVQPVHAAPTGRVTYQCPRQVMPPKSDAKPWTMYVDEQYGGIGKMLYIYQGHPHDKALLEPDNGDDETDHGPAYWNFNAGEPLWLECLYPDTRSTLIRPLAPGLTYCQTGKPGAKSLSVTCRQ